MMNMLSRMKDGLLEETVVGPRTNNMEFELAAGRHTKRRSGI